MPLLVLVGNSPHFPREDEDNIVNDKRLHAIIVLETPGRNQLSTSL
jgi:hypothetical protein